MSNKATSAHRVSVSTLLNASQATTLQSHWHLYNPGCQQNPEGNRWVQTHNCIPQQVTCNSSVHGPAANTYLHKDACFIRNWVWRTKAFHTISELELKTICLPTALQKHRDHQHRPIRSVADGKSRQGSGMWPNVGCRRQRAQQGCACSARSAGPGLGEGAQQQTQITGPLKLSRHSSQQNTSTPRQGTATVLGPGLPAAPLVYVHFIDQRFLYSSALICWPRGTVPPTVKAQSKHGWPSTATCTFGSLGKAAPFPHPLVHFVMWLAWARTQLQLLASDIWDGGRRNRKAPILSFRMRWACFSEHWSILWGRQDILLQLCTIKDPSSFYPFLYFTLHSYRKYIHQLTP